MQLAEPADRERPVLADGHEGDVLRVGEPVLGEQLAVDGVEGAHGRVHRVADLLLEAEGLEAAAVELDGLMTQAYYQIAHNLIVQQSRRSLDEHRHPDRPVRRLGHRLRP